MRQFSLELPVRTAGVAVSERYSHVCVLDRAGAVVERARVRTTTPAMQRWFGPRPARRVVLEVGTHAPGLSRLLSAQGHEVVVANAGRVRLIPQSPRKTDAVDAECLAR